MQIQMIRKKTLDRINHSASQAIPNIYSNNRNASVRPAPINPSRKITNLNKGFLFFAAFFATMLFIIILVEAFSSETNTDNETDTSISEESTSETESAALPSDQSPSNDNPDTGITIVKENSADEGKHINVKASSEAKYVEDVYLTELLCMKQGRVNINDGASWTLNTGDNCSNFIYTLGPYEEVYYKLNKDYDRLKAVWGISSYNKNSDVLNGVEIYTDGELAFSSIISGGDLPVQIDINISGCNILSIIFTEGYGHALLGDIRLLNSEKKVANPITPNPEFLPCWLTNMDYLVSDGVEISDFASCHSNTGETIAHYIKGRAGSEIEYYLKGNYSSISGLWAIDEYHKNTSNCCSFAIYADDYCVYTSPSITGGDMVQYFENININNAEKIKFVFLEGDMEACIGNIRLFP